MVKVLIVEDDLSILKLYQTKLEKEKFEVFTAENGKEGIELANEKKPEIILLDVMMPQMNGFEVLKVLKENPKTRTIPVIILSNYGELPNITEGFNMGAEDYLIKAEQTPEDILETILTVLKDKKPLIGQAFSETS